MGRSEGGEQAEEETGAKGDDSGKTARRIRVIRARTTTN
jgi:hypothetical protein